MHKEKQVPEIVFWTEDYLRNRQKELKSIIIEYPTTKARMAAALLEKWGMVACLPDGEDSAGRQKLRLMTPHELVERATDVAEIAFTAFNHFNWIEQVPDNVLAEMMPAKDEDEDDA